MADYDLLPPDPARGLPLGLVAAAQALSDEPGEPQDDEWGMTTSLGAMRVEMLVRTVSGVLASGAGREAALAAMHGLMLRLERDGHGEYSDTVVRERILDALDQACLRFDVTPFTDDEVSEVSLLISLRALDAVKRHTLRQLADANATSPTPR